MKSYPFAFASFVACIVITLGASASSPEPTYGEAPESLDYAASLSEADATAIDYADELLFLSERNPFPTDQIAPVDPISGKKYDQVIVGPVLKARRRGAGFDYYRYVTFYDISRRLDRIFDLPIQRQQCHEASDYFAQYSYAYTIQTQVSAGVKLDVLGIDASVSKTESYTMNRSLRAEPGVIADHVPYFEKQSWYGRTFIQTYDSAKKKAAFDTDEVRGSGWGVLFPFIATDDYPMPFEANNIDWTFVVQRKILRKCTPAEMNEARQNRLREAAAVIPMRRH